MRQRLSASAIMVILFSVSLLCPRALAQQANDPNNPANTNPPPAAAGGVVRFQVGGPMGGGNVMVMPGGGPMMGHDALAPLIMTLGELNLAPGFDLSAEQKQKIQSIRDDFKAATEAFRKDHADEIKQLDDQQKELMDGIQNGNIPDPGAMMELMEQRRALMQNAPDGVEHASQVRALLSAEQSKALEEKEAAQAREREEMMQRFPMMRMGGPGGPGMMPPPRPPGAPGAPAAPSDKDKEKDGKGR